MVTAGFERYIQRRAPRALAGRRERQGFCVRWNKGDFMGREALLLAKERGLSRKLCPLTIEAAGARYEDWFRRAAGTEPNCSAWLQDVAGVN